MPLRNDLLNPISAEFPAGENLRYAPIYDKIKDARREEDDAPQGDWKRERKTADWQLTIKLISEALATKTKDLQLAAWLTEAMLKREGAAGMLEALELTRGLLENFWDGLYPELEDGDAEFRAAPLQWIADKLEVPVKLAPITRGGLNYAQYIESRAVGTEESVAESYEKQLARNAAIKEGKLSAEIFDKDFDETPKKYYVALEQTYDAAIESLSQLSTLCDDKFGDVSPSFRALQNTLEEVRQTVHILLNRKREKEPDEAPPPAVEEEPIVEDIAPEPEYAPAAVATASPAAAAPARAPARAVTAEPQSWDDAVARVVVAAKYMRQQDVYNPAPYLMLRGLRWGEVRASGSSLDQTKLGAPPSEIRQALKKLALEGNWTEVLATGEIAMGMECGRGWLDLQRYTARACYELGSYYEPIRIGVIAELKAYLTEYPDLLVVTMADDTATANAETLAWINEQVIPPPPPPPEPVIIYREPEPEPEPVYRHHAPAEANGTEPPPPDAFELALKAARAGRPEEGIELLMREMAQEPSGRGRFQRKVQVAELCLGAGNDAIAMPILKEAALEIEQRKLEDWEAREAIAHPLGLFYRCLAKSDGSAEERQKLYSWICRLDPVEAMKLTR